jgi:hypothetical protein
MLEVLIITALLFFMGYLNYRNIMKRSKQLMNRLTDNYYDASRPIKDE